MGLLLGGNRANQHLDIQAALVRGFFTALLVLSFPVTAQQAQASGKRAAEASFQYSEATPNKLIALDSTRATAIFEDGKGQLHVVVQGQKLTGSKERLTRVFSDRVELTQESASQTMVLLVRINEQVSVKRAELDATAVGKVTRKTQKVSSAPLEVGRVADQIPGRGTHDSRNNSSTQ